MTPQKEVGVQNRIEVHFGAMLRYRREGHKALFASSGWQNRHYGLSRDVDAKFGIYLLITESVGKTPMTVRLWVNRHGLMRPFGRPRLSLALNPTANQEQSYCVNLVRGEVWVCVRCTSVDDPVFDVRIRGSDPIDFNLTAVANAQMAKATVVPAVTFDASPDNDCLNELYDPGTH